MRGRDLASGTLALGLAGAVCWGARQMPMGSIVDPGAGFFPFWLGVALGLMALGLMAGGALGPGLPAAPDADPGDGRRVARVLLALLLYALTLEGLGFLLATTLLLGAIVKLLGQRGWAAAALFSILATGGSHAVFALWLGVPLPRGHLFP